MKDLYRKIEEKHDLSFVDKFKEEDQVNLYAFGGLIRDIYLKREWNDFDLRITYNKPRKEREKFVENCLNEYGLEGKTVIEEQSLTVYRFLPEKSTVDEPIDVSLVPTIKDNLPDFTINAVFYDLLSHEIVDTYNGLKDLEDKLIRTVKEPQVQLVEEPHMMFRAVKFACQLGFEIESKTFREIKNNKKKVRETLEFIKNERGGIFVELFLGNIFKGLKADPATYFQLLNKTGLYEELSYFVADNLKLETKNLHLTPKDCGSYEANISYLFSAIVNQTNTTDKEGLFKKAVHLLTLDEPKQYSDFDIDKSRLVYKNKASQY